MLTRLEVQNFALIRDVGLDFAPGLNILTGETGAGKSIILGALKMLLGERAAAENIRAGCDASLVQGIFTLEDASLFADLEGFELEGPEVVISREANRHGRNLCRINGLVVPLVDEVEGIEQPREPGLSALGVGEGGPRRRRGRPTSESAQ